MTDKKEKLSVREKLDQRCEVLAEIVLPLRILYQKPTATKTQTDLLETVIGAAIWYLPGCEGLFTGEISVKAVEACRQDKKQWTKLTKEHCYPRKRAGADLLKGKTTELTGKEILVGYQTNWGRYNLVTKEENRALIPHQKNGMCAEESYKNAGISLIDIPEDLAKRRRGNQKTKKEKPKSLS
jgi:hypothetical protein